ncbi:J domain-containing protein [Vibrio rotiferianus]|uniref:J domain-containing protein n=1 Tax=Vibrio rotiferianus TaxID=190895 RepID=UPI00148C6ED1|nr:J domain-containing protein [Vibrio rotiferianus]NOH67721.1 J domain-containing protein [Vibrio rotiferianus]
MSFRTIALTLTLSACLTSTAFASQSPTQPEAQFDLAQQLALKPNPDSPSDVRYWLEQAARQSYIPAQKLLAEDYARGLTGNVDFTQATYWFTSVALNDPTDRGFLLADFVQHHQNRISTEDLLEAWYQLAALKNPQAEEAYNQFLEERFNQLRAKQVSEIVELDKTATHEEAQDIAAFEQEQKAETTNIWYASGALGLSVLIGGFAFGYRRHNKKVEANIAHESSQSLQLETQVKELQFANKQLKRQLEKVFKEFKKIKGQSDNQKLAIASATFGYTPQRIPDSKAVKLRYRQLSKLYHPDSRGSEDEMKRLNQAFKIISQNVTKE